MAGTSGTTLKSPAFPGLAPRLQDGCGSINIVARPAASKAASRNRFQGQIPAQFVANRRNGARPPHAVDRAGAPGYWPGELPGPFAGPAVAALAAGGQTAHVDT